MNAVTTEIPALAHDAGVPPAPPEAHRQADDVRDLPLKRLVASPYNVRRVPRTGIKELALNIWRTGRLLQNVVVHAMKVGPKKAQTFGVAAGERRRLALVYLLEHGYISADYPVRCLLVSVEDAVLLSATENEMREPMHPADACDAYRVLVDAGRAVAEVAEIYGVSVQTVQRRLKLARVSPKLVDLFRDDQIGADQMMALALSDSHDEQERAWFDAQPHDRHAQAIRRKLVAGERDFLNNRVALYVGIDAFEAAGGSVRRDLFSDDGTAWYSDQALMERVALEQLGVVAAEVLNEGWDWVEPVLTFDYHARCRFAKIAPTSVPPTDEQQQELDAIDARVVVIAEQQEAADIDEETYDRLCDEETALSERYAAIEESLAVYTPDQRAGAGAIVTIEQDGTLTIMRGWVKKPEATNPAADNSSDDSNDTDDDGSGATVHGPSPAPAPKEDGPHSAALTRRLNARRTAAVGMALARQPHVALAALVHRFLAAEYAAGSAASALDIQWHDKADTVERAAPELADDLAYRLHSAQRSGWSGVIPADSAALFDWCVEQTDERLMLILAQYVAASLDSVTIDERPHAINSLIPALGLNMADEWKPTRASYFDHVPKARIADVVAAAVSHAEGMRIAKLKKADAAAEAERLMAGRGWLPEHLAQAEVRTSNLWQLLQERDDDPEHDSDDDDQPGAASVAPDEQVEQTEHVEE
ncbi:ParB/RepB/Spo0J family partition protein [Burkholderia stagnalis]|uniref:ParB/RepB/Spo0J family partition protein n=1 Tax=Burkholderia stagnalis TaxID=1503054 RepID=UPI000F5EDDFB|nr:ParB/RepB/Spo0J family partition protein [Burkholderia stagnalis]RQX95026.1 ParB/RepB/Spo0J family partition protein [Burkholderia stagnalis]RQY27954.1 ParB/RepB/Spo0J family partition protein [Burkholderia stagnalis]RQY56551.1 ParB/RepB/Spo0J family partition protein [Burkholderia stagnalis]RQY86322.1 ParB/RepB/Spo0J family partition protein [Burkholderia stagnalis]